MITLGTYDIANQRRLSKFHRFISQYGIGVQRSVFECDLDKVKRAEIEAYCRTQLHRKQDSVRFYSVCSACRATISSLGVCKTLCTMDFEVV